MMEDVLYRFLHPWMLVLLPLPFIWLMLQVRREKKSPPALLYSDLSVARGLPVSMRQRAWRLLPWLRTGALCLAIIALARPQCGTVEYSASAVGADISMVIDVSGSMQARDVQPNRLEASKTAAAEFVRSRRNDRVSVVLFGEDTAVLCPPTLDMKAVEMFIDSIYNGIISSRATAIGDGLGRAIDLMKDSDVESRVIILLTDGDNNAGVLEPLQAAEMARALDIRIYTIGVGQPYVPGLSIRADFDERPLIEIAEMTGGEYYHAGDEESLEQVYRDIDKLERSPIEVDEVADFNERFMVFWFPGLLLLGVEIFLRAFWLRRLP